jgi:hypothetical protein
MPEVAEAADIEDFMKDEREDRKNKKPYQSPVCETISLRPEEAVLGNCKSMVVSGPSGGPSSCGIAACSSSGS